MGKRFFRWWWGDESPSSRSIHPNKDLDDPKVNPDVTIGDFNGTNPHIIVPQKLEQTAKTNWGFLKDLKPKCEWFKNMEKKNKRIFVGGMVVFIVSLITLAIVLPIILTQADPPMGSESSSISIDDSEVLVSLFEVSKGRHRGEVLGTHRKIQMSYPTVESITRMIRNSKDEEQILFSIPVFSILETFGNAQKQEQAYTEWLEDYNANPRNTVDRLVDMIREKMSKVGTKKFGKRVPDNLTLISVVGGEQIDVSYDIDELKFKAVKFDPNYVDPEKIQFEKKENLRGNRKNKSKVDANKTPESNVAVEKKPENSVPDATSNASANATANTTTNATATEKVPKKPLDKDQVMVNVMKSTIYYIKRVVSRSVQFLRSKTAELEEYQKKIVSETQVDQEWQTVLVNECKTLDPLRFRCSIEGAMKLDKDLTLEKIQDPNSEYVIMQVLNLKFKQVKVQAQ